MHFANALLLTLAVILCSYTAKGLPTSLQAGVAEGYNPCNGEQFYPDPKDCHKFYHCHDDRPSHKDCPADLHWDTTLNTCNYPEVANCVASSDTDSEGSGDGSGSDTSPDDDSGNDDNTGNICQSGKQYYPDSESCNYYYQCSNGVAYRMPCAEGTEWNAKLNVCDWPSNAGCSTASSGETGSGGSGSDESGNEGSDEGADNICQGEQYYPDPESCKYFYQCSNGHPYHMPCAEGTEWNNRLHVCDWPANAGCSTSGTTPAGTDSGKTTKDDGASDEDGGSNICQGDQYYPDPESCNYFYQCSNGVPYHMPCAPGTEWNNQLHVCDWPEHAGCSTGEGTTAGFTTEYDDDSEECEEVTSEESTDGSTNICQGEQYYPDPESCDFFYQCSNGVPYHMPCAAGTEWNNKLHVCDWPANAGCTTGSTSEETGSGGSDDDTSGGDDGTSGGDDSGDGGDAGNICQGEQYYPDPQSCKYFYQCSNGVPYHMPCGEGTEWNNKIHVCDWPADAGCTIV